MKCGPVLFVHSSFRTGSTWFQSRFRANPAFCSYIEAYNEQLATLRLRDMARINYSSWNSKHPPSAPYFAEYAPLLREEGGVEGFHADFAFSRFFPDNQQELPGDERAYIASLIDNARSVGKIPLISFTRSLGRAAALRAAFGGTHIFIYRNLFNQWCSYTRQAADGNHYFLQTVDRTIAACHDEQFRKMCLVFEDHSASPDSAFLFIRFVLLHLHLYRQAAAACDYNLFMEDLAETNIREDLEVALSAATGVKLEFGGYTEGREFSLVDLEPSVLTEAVAMFTSAGASPDNAKCQIVLSRCCQTLLEAYRQYRGEKLREIEALRMLYKRNQELKSECGNWMAGLDDLKSELARRTAELEENKSEIARLTSELEQHRFVLSEREAADARAAEARPVNRIRAIRKLLTSRMKWSSVGGE